MRPLDFRPAAAADIGPAAAATTRQPPENLAASVERLEGALGLLAEFAKERAVPTSVVVNPLLVVWDAAHEVAAEVSVPVETLLTAAVHRSSLGADEVIGCIQEVRALALQEAVLAELVNG